MTRWKNLSALPYFPPFPLRVQFFLSLTTFFYSSPGRIINSSEGAHGLLVYQGALSLVSLTLVSTLPFWPEQQLYIRPYYTSIIQGNLKLIYFPTQRRSSFSLRFSKNHSLFRCSITTTSWKRFLSDPQIELICVMSPRWRYSVVRFISIKGELSFCECNRVNVFYCGVYIFVCLCMCLLICFDGANNTH